MQTGTTKMPSHGEYASVVSFRQYAVDALHGMLVTPRMLQIATRKEREMLVTGVIVK